MAIRSPALMPSSTSPSDARRTRSSRLSCEIGSYRPLRLTCSASALWYVSTASKNSLLSVPGAELRGPPVVVIDVLAVSRNRARGGAFDQISISLAGECGNPANHIVSCVAEPPNRRTDQADGTLTTIG